MHNLREFTLAELSAAVKGLGFPEYRARQAYDWLYKSRVESVNDMKNLPAELKDKIAADYDCKLPELKAEAVSDIDNTVKYLFGFEDGASVESVLMYEDDRVTLCASTQAGCACGCRFCATGSLGYKRNLTVSEIIGQFIAAEKLSSVKITNIVFMGMGEPLLNWENLKKAVLILSDNKGINFSQTRITVSTVGITPVIREIAEAKYKFNLAVSLISADNEIRSDLMPFNRKYPLKDIVNAVKYYNMETGREVMFEYILFEGINDSEEDAEKLIRLLRQVNYKVNLIPYNSVENSGFTRPSREKILRFQKIIMSEGKKVFIRREKGADIAAACGQLAGKFVKKGRT